MDTRTGEIKLLNDLTNDDLKSGMFKRIEIGLTELQTENKKIGRNDLCGCGSGEKFKNCCLKEKQLNIKNRVLVLEEKLDKLEKPKSDLITIPNNAEIKKFS